MLGTSVRTMLCAAVLAALAVVSVSGPAFAQSDSWNALYDRIIRLEHEVRSIRSTGGGGGATGDLSYRLTAIEDQLRQILGSVGAMREEMGDMKRRLRSLEEQKSGRVATPQYTESYQTGNTSSFVPYNDDADGLDLTVLPQDSETQIIGSTGQAPLYEQPQLQDQQVPGSQVLGQLVIKNDTGISGSDETKSSLLPGQVESASLDTIGGGAGNGSSIEGQFQQAHKNLLGRRFGMAEAGFKTLLNQHPKHPSGSKTRYWLGETYYVQGRYKQAAQSFLVGYKSYPSGSRAPESLLKLGMSLNKLGQKKQACGAYSEVQRAYPGAAKVREQAVRESKRAGC